MLRYQFRLIDADQERQGQAGDEKPDGIDNFPVHRVSTARGPGALNGRD
jgi:hypothetical protein